MPDTLTLSVPDMSCGHCRASITEALAALGVTATFDMTARHVRLGGVTDQDVIIGALDRIGFEAHPVGN